MPPEAELARVRAWIAEARRVVALTGAGISTESGIPDFRGPQGVWTKNPAAEKQSTIQTYVADPEVRKAAWLARAGSAAWTAEPNAGHRALVALERRGTLHALVTQNIDELHQRAGTSPEAVVEVHGTMRRVVCLSCGRRWPMEHALDRVRGGEADPACEAEAPTRPSAAAPRGGVAGLGAARRPACGGILKSDTISFGQNLIPAVIDRALRVAGECDLLLAVGTTLQVYPVAGMVPIAAQAGARVVIVNAEATAMDALADAVLRGPIGEILPVLCDSD